MRAYVGALVHETNAFSPVATNLASYHEARLGYRELTDAACEAGLEVHRGLSFRAAPSAPTVRADYETLRDKLVADILETTGLDLVLLALHGAQVAQGYEDCEGDILARLRQALGSTVVIAVLLDLHASVSEQMLANADLLLSIKEYPHTNYPQSARQLVRLAMATARGDIAPVTAFLPLPLFTLWHTPEPPSRDIVAAARELEARGEVLYVSLVHGFPWADVSSAGAAVLVTTDADANAATHHAQILARALWDIRGADLDHYIDIPACIAALQTAEGGPIVIADAADNPGAGCGGDATWLLHALLAAGVRDVAVGMLIDEVALDAAIDAGPGSRVHLRLGGYSGDLAGPPLEADFEVLTTRDDALIDAMPGSAPVGPLRLALLRTRGIDIVVSAYREQVFGPRAFDALGLDVRCYRAVIVKSAQHFYQAFAPLASQVLYVDSPCSRTIDFGTLPFTRRRRPVWPLEDATLEPIAPARLFPRRAGDGQDK